MKTFHDNISPDYLTDTGNLRNTLDTIQNRLDLLQDKDKAIMELYLTRRTPFRQIAILTGVHETTIARRIRNLTNALIHGPYITCLTNSNLSRTELAIIREHFMEGLTFKEISERHGVTMYRIRALVSHIKKSNPQARAFRKAGAGNACIHN